VQPDSDDDAWRSIVEHYGERFPIDPDDSPRAEPAAEPSEVASAEPLLDDVEAPDVAPGDGDEEGFVPPQPPPLPRIAPDRLLAWTGVFGTPVVLLTAVVTGLHLPGWLGYLLVTAFVGGFVYLVSRMPRGPSDPADDGARL
jgi:hypothetical protein